MKFAEYDSPCGKLLLGVHGQSISLCDWMIHDRVDRTLRRIDKYLTRKLERDDASLLDHAANLLDAYFKGKLKTFDIPLSLCGTEFQRRVWKELLKVPYGTTTSYKTIAESVSLPSGTRAVASAIGANPLSIFIPCHRIIGADGALTGYAGGLDAKRYLLQLESGN